MRISKGLTLFSLAGKAVIRRAATRLRGQACELTLSLRESHYEWDTCELKK